MGSSLALTLCGCLSDYSEKRVKLGSQNNSNCIKISSLDSGTETVSLILTSSHIHRDWRRHRSVGGQREEVSSQGTREQQGRGSVHGTSGSHVSSTVKSLITEKDISETKCTHNFTYCLAATVN